MAKIEGFKPKTILRNLMDTFRKNQPSDEQPLSKKDLDSLERYFSKNQSFSSLNAGFWVRDSIDGQMIFISKGIADIFQVSVETLYENPDFLQEFILEGYWEEYIKERNKLHKGKDIEVHYQIQTNDGRVKWVYEQGISKINPKGNAVYSFGLMLETTSFISMKNQLDDLYYKDYVTMLPNRRGFELQLKQIVEERPNDSFSLVYIHVNDLSRIYDLHGVEIGERVLFVFVRRLRSLVGEDEFLARLTNSKFMLLIPRKTDADVRHLVNNILELLNQEIEMNPYKFYLTANVGISTYPDDGEDLFHLMKRTNEALDHSRRYGRNVFKFARENHQSTFRDEFSLEKDLRSAINRNSFRIFYQPLVDPKTNLVKGAEALLRWEHEYYGMITPDEFIPFAESKCFIYEIDQLVIQSVFKQMRKWKEKNYELFPVFINISSIQLKDFNLPEIIRECSAKEQIPTKYIVLELTKESHLEMDDEFSNKIKDLQKLGVKIALDDFGVGLQSFKYLQSMDADILKIDQVLTRNLMDNPQKNRAIIYSLLYLAKQLQMTTVVEGVETSEQLKICRQSDCNLVQGYVYSKPLPVAKFEEVFQRKFLKPKQTKIQGKPEVERRRYYRLTFPGYLEGKMSIAKIYQKEVKTGKTNILIENIGLGGIKFYSPLKIPVVDNLELNFQFTMMGKPFDVKGVLVWSEEKYKDIYCYGISFECSKNTEAKLIEVINSMMIHQKRKQ